MDADKRHVIPFPKDTIPGAGVRKHNVLIVRVNPRPSAVSLSG